MEAELRALARQMGIEDRVIMPGRVPHERVAGVYAMVDVLVYPRYPMRLTELVTPLKPLEAMAMGKALIASDVGGHRELITDGETGVMFPAGDLEGLVAALGKVLSDGHLAATLEQEGKAWVSRAHTWAKTTSVYRDIYDAQVHVG
ncbi:glycosyltransferase [Desulfoluna spongiiphila]|nr:glycosyltransferase [Desulfoluna spongiiphila]